MEKQEGKSEVGAITGTIIVIIILLVGAVYFFNQGMNRQKQIESMTPQESILTSDSIDSIQNDAALIDLKDLGEGVDKL